MKTDDLSTMYVVCRFVAKMPSIGTYLVGSIRYHAAACGTLTVVGRYLGIMSRRLDSHSMLTSRIT